MFETNEYKKEFESHLAAKLQAREPQTLYRPVQYILELQAKRIRPILVMLSTEVFGGNRKEALDAAVAVEIFHNFSLVHDDIMDDAPLRRGEKTVHEKWDINTGILSGDVMLVMAYQLLEPYQGETFRALFKVFSETAVQVCEGQQYDIDYETKDDVSVAEYLRMIEYKTAVLVGASLQMGAIVAGTSDRNKKAIYDFGRLLGIAFQLQDDYLDVFGDPRAFGKQIGGDIIENKKTFLYLSALNEAREGRLLEHLYSINPPDSSAKIETVKTLFQSSGAADLTRQEIERYTQEAFRVLDQLEVSDEKKLLLRKFGENLMDRQV